MGEIVNLSEYLYFQEICLKRISMNDKVVFQLNNKTCRCEVILNDTIRRFFIVQQKVIDDHLNLIPKGVKKISYKSISCVITNAE